MNNRVICIVQARMGSNRLPGKVLRNIVGKPMLQHIIDRLKICKQIDELIIATSNKHQDDDIENLCLNLGVKCFRGSEENVLSRYYFCAKENNADVVVRITSDCPLIDPELIDDVIAFFNKSSYDYVSPRTKDGLIRGLDVEVFSINALEKAFKECEDESGLEHVTYYIYSNNNKFNIKGYPVPAKFKGLDIRLCVDEEQDLKKIKEIYKKFYKGKVIDTDIVINYLINNPHINDINKNVKQKSI